MYPERNLLLTIEYDGTYFSGWQRQPNVPTVQGEVEAVLSTLCQKEIQINGAGRTDAGVHAYGQRANFSGQFGIPTDRLAGAANNLLWGRGGHIRIVKAEEVPPDFHARFNAGGKTYLYKISNSREPDIFLRNYRYHVSRPLCLEDMREGAEGLVGTHDFKSFQASGGEERETTVRTIYDLKVTKPEPGEILLSVTGDGFLYNMVRIIAGTLVDIGLGKIPSEKIRDILNSGQRAQAGHTAPPEGLYLAEVYYS